MTCFVFYCFFVVVWGVLFDLLIVWFAFDTGVWWLD